MVSTELRPRRLLSAAAAAMALLTAAGCVAAPRYWWMKEVGLRDEQFAAACGPATKFTAAIDAQAGAKIAPSERRAHDLLSDLPRDPIRYEGTRGVITQHMRAAPVPGLCPAGGKVLLQRPDPEADRDFNRDCCPSGLSFASSGSTAIRGTPKSPGTYPGKVLLCARCEDSMGMWYPKLVEFEWIIEGQRPRRLD